MSKTAAKGWERVADKCLSLSRELERLTQPARSFGQDNEEEDSGSRV